MSIVYIVRRGNEITNREASKMKQYYINQWNKMRYRHNRKRNIHKAGGYKCIK